MDTARIIRCFWSAVRLFITLPFALLGRLRHPKVWLVAERPDQARDNGYCFYAYLRERYPSLPVYYIIEQSARDRDKLIQYGENHLIDYDSLRHYYYFCLSRVHISAHTEFAQPSNSSFVRWLRPWLGYRTVFVPHGISYGISDFCLAKYGHIDLFLCSGRSEYNNVITNYGYASDQVMCTGFPRFDRWYSLHINPRQIVLMPTWRIYLARDSELIFENTKYYKAYAEFINDERLAEFLLSNNLTMVFYLHINMRKYVNSFRTSCSQIIVAYRDDDYDIQELLKESALLITDYSSVHFDFAYMGKPVLYYQFDREDFWSCQYAQSDFDATTDGFGPVAYDIGGLISNLREAYRQGFELRDAYYQRMRAYFELHDRHNCDRVYEAIQAFWR